MIIVIREPRNEYRGGCGFMLCSSQTEWDEICENTKAWFANPKNEGKAMYSYDAEIYSRSYEEWLRDFHVKPISDSDAGAIAHVFGTKLKFGSLFIPETD